MGVRKRMLLLVASVVVLSAAPTCVQAQRGNGPCSEDIQKLCPGVQAGGGRYRACLKEHETELSPACEEHLRQTKARAAGWRQACEGDVQRFCSHAEPKGRMVVQCLRDREADLSAACKEQLRKGRQRRRGGAAAAGQ